MSSCLCCAKRPLTWTKSKALVTASLWGVINSRRLWKSPMMLWKQLTNCRHWHHCTTHLHWWVSWPRNNYCQMQNRLPCLILHSIKQCLIIHTAMLYHRHGTQNWVCVAMDFTGHRICMYQNARLQCWANPPTSAIWLLCILVLGRPPPQSKTVFPSTHQWVWHRPPVWPWVHAQAIWTQAQFCMLWTHWNWPLIRCRNIWTKILVWWGWQNVLPIVVTSKKTRPAMTSAAWPLIPRCTM